ncbi:MAG: stage V sporulation protein T, partial [Peptococcaceae bacterium]|nr:stage V sporulation protein T [Peptococcaceae bacterium]
GAAAEKVMEERKAVSVSDTGIHALFRGTSDNGIERTLHTQIIAPIIAEGDPIGSVIIASKDTSAKLGELELKLAETAASFLAKQMEQ